MTDAICHRQLIELIKSKKVLIFDFDGVLADSVEVKTDAFAELYRPYGQIVMNKVIDHHRANGGMSRFDKFRHYHPEFLGKAVTNEDVDRLSSEFSQIVVDKVVNSAEIPGATSFLERYCKEKVCVVNSATPQDEIRDIVAQRGWADFFVNVYGAPTSKLDNLKNIFATHRDCNKNDFLFFGDALSDLNAATKTDIDFIGIGHEEQSVLAREISTERLIADFSCLLKK